MFYLGSLLMLWTLLAMCAAVGRRVCGLLPPRLRPAARLYFSPLFGAAAFMLLATAHGWAAPFNTWACLAEAALLTGASVYWEKDKKALAAYVPRLALYAVPASFAVLAPILIYASFNPFNDAFTYLVHGQWLQSNAFSTPISASGYFPALTQVVDYQVNGQRMGASFLLGWAQALFHRPWSYGVYPAVTSLGLVSGSLAVAGATQLMAGGRRVFPLMAGLAAALLFNGYSFGALCGFFPQTFGLAFLLGGAACLAALLDAPPRSWGETARAVFPAALLFAALVFGYNECLPFVGAGLAVFIAFRLLRRPGNARGTLTACALLAAEAALLVNVELVRVARNFVRTVLGAGGGAKVIGWPVLWRPVSFLAGAFGFRPILGGNKPVWLWGVPDILFIGLFAAGAWALVRGPRRRSPVFEAVLSLLAVYTGGFLAFRYVSASPWPQGVGHSFLQFKMVQWASPFCAALMGTAVAVYARRFKGRARGLAAVFGFLLGLGVWGNVWFAKGLTRDFLNQAGSRFDAFSRLLRLRDLAEPIPRDGLIYFDLGTAHDKLRQMAAYVLFDRKLASDYRQDGYILNRLPLEEAAMPIARADWVVTFAEPGEDVPADSRAGNMVLRQNRGIRGGVPPVKPAKP